MEPDAAQLKILHQTIRKVTEDIEGMRYNTAIAAMMEFLNEVTRWDKRPQSVLKTFVLILSPFAPHIAEELWFRLGNHDSLAYEPWPAFNPAYLEESQIEVVVQVNGKLRGRIVVAKSLDEASLLAAAKSEPNVASQLSGKTIRKEIVVPGKLVNIVVG
jgi:leucyl-tRNA synthetase